MWGVLVCVREGWDYDTGKLGKFTTDFPRVSARKMYENPAIL
jgi:hypothetical protein